MAETGETDSRAFPEKDKEHKEVEVKILEIKDAKGNSIKDGAIEYDPRKNAVDGEKRTIVKYEVKNNDALVMISIIAMPGNKIAQKYYKNEIIEMFLGEGNKGEHTYEWDGRVHFDFQRLIILGEYKVELDAICMECAKSTKDEATIKVKKPYAHAFGALYPAADYPAGARDLRPPANYVRTKLKNLDKSGKYA